MNALKYYYFLTLYYAEIRYMKWEHRKNEQMVIAYDAMLYALLTHHKVRQSYDEYPYFFHVRQVAHKALDFQHLVGADALICFIGALFHDLIEDCRLTYNDIESKWGKEIADIVFACTETRGRNRAERHGPEYYQGLKDSRLGLFVKLCDIIANMERGKTTGSGMLKKYQKEYPHTKHELYREEFKEMFDYIETNLL